MATRCTKCGTFLTEGERFCPNCGENAPQPVAPAPAPIPAAAPQPQQTYQQYGGQSAPAAAPVPSYNYAAYQAQEEMSLGKWVGTILLTNFLGIISLILLFVWGFGSGPKSRQNYCKAMLIVKAIGIILGIAFFAMCAAWLVPFLERIIEEADYGYYSGFSSYTGELAAFLKNIFR